MQVQPVNKIAKQDEQTKVKEVDKECDDKGIRMPMTTSIIGIGACPKVP